MGVVLPGRKEAVEEGGRLTRGARAGRRMGALQRCQALVGAYACRGVADWAKGVLEVAGWATLQGLLGTMFQRDTAVR